MAATSPTGPPHSRTSLYVGDLSATVTEADLFSKFVQAGPVLSIRVCRDAITRRSLGYAYVNFQQPADAERALELMNFDMVCGKPIRIMWAQRDPSTRRAGSGNIFIKNLERTIDTRAVYDTFSMFGRILSCKVVVDEEFRSRGYGFVHFESEEAAQRAIDSVNGMLLEGKKVFVGKFQPRSLRVGTGESSATHFTNVFVKNFANDLDKEKLEKLFSRFGRITSAVVMLDDKGNSRGFGFVAFEEHDSAKQAVSEMHEYTLPGTELKLYVSRAQKKGERLAELKKRYEEIKAERARRSEGKNLYVKNFDKNVDDETLKRTFEGYGEISSAKVMRDERGCSKGFGFVCFETIESANKALVEMNGKTIFSKRLYVALAQRKADRQALLAAQYAQRLASTRMYDVGGPMNSVYMPNTRTGIFVSPTMPTRNQPAFFSPTTNYGVASMHGASRWNTIGSSGLAGYRTPFVVQRNVFNMGGRDESRTRCGGGGSFQWNGHQKRFWHDNGAHQSGARRVMAFGRMASRQAQSATQKQNTAVAEVHPMQQRRDSAATEIIEPLSAHTLAQAAPEEQKQMLGERLYRQIEGMCAREDVGKITGMILEMDNAELLMLLENEDLLRVKVAHAAAVLASALGGAEQRKNVPK